MVGTHNPKVSGSNPLPATKLHIEQALRSLTIAGLCFMLSSSYGNYVNMDTKLKGDIAEQAAVLHALKRGWGVKLKVNRIDLFALPNCKQN